MDIKSLKEYACLKQYEHCTLCPNRCGVNRAKGELGVCKASDKVKIAFCGLHRGEEPPVTGRNGSGMLFFSGCPLHCKYCQNYQISCASEDSPGVYVSIEELASLMLSLQEQGAATLNLVTPTHYIPSICTALALAKRGGLKLPVVYNGSGYESIEALKLIDPFIDLYLMDIKTLSPEVAGVFCGTAKYAAEVLKVAEFLTSNYPRTFYRKNRLYGVIVRHLVFPGTISATRDFLRWYAQNMKHMSYLSLMVQFVPPKGDDSLKPMQKAEYDILCSDLEQLGIDDGFVQEFGDEAGFEKETMWIPDFNRDLPFPENFAEANPLFLQLKHAK